MKSLLQKNTYRKRTILVSIGVVTCFLGLSYYVYGLGGTILGWPQENTMSDTVDLKPATNDQVDTGQEIKKTVIEQSQKDEEKGTINENKKSFIVTVSASNKSEHSYQLRVLIDSLIMDGTCELILKKDSTSIIKEAKTQSLANNSTCQGFDIPLSELESGEWSYVITVKNGEGSTSDTAGNITI